MDKIVRSTVREEVRRLLHFEANVRQSISVVVSKIYRIASRDKRNLEQWESIEVVECAEV